MFEQPTLNQVMTTICAVLGLDTGIIVVALWFVYTKLKEIRNQMALTKEEFIAAVNASTAELKQHVTDASGRVTTTVNALTAEIEDLKTKVGQVLTQEDLDGIVNAQKEVIIEVDQVDPTTPPPNPV